jgi:2-isopropylmalate synthase
MLKNRETYEIMTPASVGVPMTNLVLGKHSGKAAVENRLQALGVSVSDADMARLMEAFKVLADRKKEIYDGDLFALVEEIVRGTVVPTWKLDYLHSSAGTEAIATATVKLTKDGVSKTDAATGDGPVDAVIQALNRICGVEGSVEDYRLRAVSKGGDAQGEVSIRAKLKPNDTTDAVIVGGKGLSTDIVHASALAYLDAINRMGFQVGRLDYRTAAG